MRARPRSRRYRACSSCAAVTKASTSAWHRTWTRSCRSETTSSRAASSPRRSCSTPSFASCRASSATLPRPSTTRSPPVCSRVRSTRGHPSSGGRGCPTCCSPAITVRSRAGAVARPCASRSSDAPTCSRPRSSTPTTARSCARSAGPAMADLYLALLHHPVLDKNGAVVTTAVTNMDVHDIARLSRTYGVRGFYVCTPVPTLQRLVARIIWHWESGPGAVYNETRKEALAMVRVVDELDAAVTDIERETGMLPAIVATSAREGGERLAFAGLRERLARAAEPVLLLFGTGWGLTPEVLARCHAVLDPVRGTGTYNH